MEHPKKPSITRTYVAICNRSNFEGHYFRKFHLPTHRSVGYQENGEWVEGSYSEFFENTNEFAAWYFLNVLNYIACIDGVVSYEDYTDLKDEDVCNQAWRQESLPLWN